MILHKIYFVIFNLKQNLWPQILFIYLKSFENKKKWWIDEFNERKKNWGKKKKKKTKLSRPQPNKWTRLMTRAIAVAQLFHLISMQDLAKVRPQIKRNNGIA